jgi:hypothetical protein
MKADRVEVSKDQENEQWLVRIKVGEEVIRRKPKAAKNADESTLRQAAVEVAGEEGYTVDPADVVIV